MSTPDATLPSLSELEAALKAVNRNSREEHLLAVLAISKIQDMFQQTLHIGDIEHYGSMLQKLKNTPRSASDRGLVSSAFKRLDSALDMMVMGVSMSPDGKLNKAPRSFTTYLHLTGASYLGTECKKFAQQASWGDYIDLVKYLMQDNDHIVDSALNYSSEEIRNARLNDLACSFSTFAGKDVGWHLLTLMGRYGQKELPSPVVDLLREREDRFADRVTESTSSNSDSLKMVDHYKSAGLLKLAAATIEASKCALFMSPDHFLKLAEQGVVFDDAWHEKRFETTTGGSAAPQLVYHFCAGGTYCPPLAELDAKKRTSIVVECCNSSYPRSPEIFARVKAFLEEYVKDGDMSQELISAGLDTDIAKHVKIMLPHAFSKDLGL